MSWVDDYKKDMGVQDTGVTQPTGPKKINWTEDYKNDAQAGTLESVTAQPKTSWMPDLGNLISEDSPVNMVLTQQNLNEMGGTVKDLGKLAMRPYGIVEGAMEFGSAMPGFLAGLVGAGQGLAKDIALAPEASIKHNYDAALQGFQREASKFPAWDSGRPETKLVGRTMMAPLEAIQGPLHALADSDFINNIPLVGEDISGLLKFLGDVAGLITQHGMSVRGKVYDPKIKLFKEKVEKEGRLTEEDRSELGTIIKEMDKETEQIKDGTLTTLNVDPLAKLDEAYKPEPPQTGVKPTGEPSHTFTSNRGNEYVKIDGSWYNKDSYTKVTNKFIVQAAEAKSKTIDAKPTPKTLAESHQLARKESETTKALHEARTGAEARRTVNEELQLELERARKGEVKPVEVSEGPKPKETKPVVELDPTADDYIAQTFKNRETEVKTGKAEKRSIRARLTKARRDGEIKRGDAVRFTTIDELLDLLRTKPGEKLRNTSETGEIHATPIMGEKGETFTAYGSYEKHSVAVVVPKEHTMAKKGSTTVEVLVNPETPIDKLRFVIGKDKRLLTADQVKQELLKLKKEEPKVEPKVETKVEPEAEPVFEPIEIEPESEAEVKPEARPTVEPAPTAIKLQKGEEPPVKAEPVKAYHGTSSVYVDSGIVGKTLTPKSMKQIVGEVLDLLKLKGKARLRARQKIYDDDYFASSIAGRDRTRPFDKGGEVYITSSLDQAREYANWAGEAYDHALMALGGHEGKSGRLSQRAKKLYDRNRAAEPVILEVETTGELGREDAIRNEPVKVIRIVEDKPRDKTSVESKPSEVPEFPKEALKDLEDSEKPRSAKKNQVIEVDGVEEYDIVSKEYESFEGAQRAAEKSPQLAKRRKELAKSGASLEVVKIGDKFRVAERLSLTEVERQAIMEALEGSEKTTVVDPELAMERLKAIAPDVVKWHKGDTSIPIDTLMDEVASLVEGSKGKTDPLMAEVVTAADKMLTLVKEKQREQFLPKRSGDLFVAKSEKNPNLDIVLNKEGQPFEEMFDALAYMQEHKLQGVVNDAAGGKGFVIELRKPTSLVRTKRETLVDIKGILGELEKEDLADLDKVESSKPKGQGKRKIIKETVKSEGGETSIFTDMWGWVFGKNKRPTLSVAEFQKMSGQRIDSLRRLSKDAMDRRITVEALAKQLGFDETQARYIQALAEDVMRYVKRNVSYHDTEAFKSGEVANGGPTNWQHKKTKEQLWVPEISQGELAELKAANVIDKGLTGGFTREWLPTVHAVNDFKSPLVRALHRDSQRLQVQVDKDIRTLRRTLATKQKNAGKGSGDRIYLRALWEQADLRERMEAGGFTEADIPKLTPREQEVYDWMRAEYELAYPEINDVRAHIGKRRMRYTPDYMTLFFAEGWASKAGHASNCVLDSWDTMTNRVVQFRKTKFDFSKTRSKKKALSQISENAYDVFSRYMEQKIRFTTMSPLISKIAQMNKGLKDGVVHYKTKKGEAKTKPKIFMLKNKNPVLSEFLNRWSNHLAGKDIDAVLHLSDTTSNRFWEKLTRKISGNIAVTTLGFLFRTSLIQASALKNTAVVAGFPYTALGVLETLRPKTFRETLKESGLVEYRRGETILEDWYKYTEKGGYEGLKRASMALLQYMDVKTAAASYRAFKRYGLKELKLREKEARKYADEMVTQTQASALPGDIAPVQRSTLGKAITLFQTFTINDWAFMYKEVFGIDRALTKKERAKRMVALAIGTVMFTSLYEDVLKMNSPFSTPFRTAYRLRDMDVPLTDKLMVIGKEILEPVPEAGGAARYGSHPLGIAVDLAGQVFKSISGDQTARPFWETAGRFAPVPGLGQFAKSLHGYKRGADFWEILMGQPPEKQKILGRTPGRKTVKY